MDYFSGVSASGSAGSAGTTGAGDFSYFPPIIPPSAPGSGSTEEVAGGFKVAQGATVAAAAMGAGRRQSENAGRPATGVSTPSGSVVSRDGSSAHSTNTGATSVWMASPEEDQSQEPKAPSSDNTLSYASVATAEKQPAVQTYASAMGRSASEHQDDKKMSTSAGLSAAARSALLHRPDSDPIVAKLAGRGKGGSEGL
ncbi:hypothetical protein CONPUDRAFT_83847 [Coniophora puteana RWD-64-598 SS2]|uniref:Uncharacterized protein n=1 Tax=Coniophora puteana (strain RWD-64-598) TaxID=741705 RepID=A0A5M3MGS9_CONPW|nr:uncharacterized protein CONPUDRAFT_83847 [Coniophora puteana RWD-64-598 SS2]EIW78439.1 hypothetical protein CONPUDRAFT_83847 [Coniophora puteana RWD-64-598 SS2]